MLALLCSLLVAVHTLAAVNMNYSECSSNSNQQVSVKGWPVQVALRIPIRASVTLSLNFSAHNNMHTTLLINQETQEGKVGKIEMDLDSHMAKKKLHMAALLPDSYWGTVKLGKRHKKLELRVESEADSANYTSTASVDLMHHMDVDTVSCNGPNCNVVDLQCLRSDGSDADKEDLPEDAMPEPSTSSSPYHWALYAVIALLVVVCLLFFVWWNERNKFRIRWMRHSQAVRQAADSNTDQEGNSSPTAVTGDAVKWKTGGKGGECSFAYNGPCIGDSD